VNVYIVCDLAPAEVNGMSPARVADLLMAFNGIRQLSFAKTSSASLGDGPMP
jgi:hypothetical protein